jgi:hypothetical protein
MEILQQNSKAIAAAAATMVVVCLKPFWPAVVDPAFQPALEVLLSVAFVVGSVWVAPANKPKDTPHE